MLASTKKAFAKLDELTASVEALTRNARYLHDRLRTLEMKPLEDSVLRFQARLEAASTRGIAAVTRYGQRVGYLPPWSRSGVVWTGVVIPRPQGYPAFSSRTQQPLTYIVRDGDRAIRGCFASNLVFRP